MQNNALKLVDAGLLRIGECCRFLRISRAKLYEIMDEGELPYVKIGRSRRIPQQAMKEFAASRVVGMAAVDSRPR